MSQDVIRRVLEGHCGREVFFVMGVTDVDDKIIARAQQKCVRACVKLSMVVPIVWASRRLD